MDVTVTATNLFGQWLYRVWVDGVLYDKMFSNKRITDSQMYDVAQGYREGLERYESQKY